MGTTRTLADGEAFVQGRSQETAAKLVTAAAEADLKGSVRTTYDGYIAPAEVVKAAGFDASTESSTPENPADHSDEANAKYDGAAAAAQEASTGTEELPATPETPGDDNVPNPDADADADAEAEADLFDPTKATVDEVTAYLDEADAEERERVLAAEAAGKNRKTIAEYTAEEGK